VAQRNKERRQAPPFVRRKGLNLRFERLDTHAGKIAHFAPFGNWLERFKNDFGLLRGTAPRRRAAGPLYASENS
jgi:hypothetical protein